MKRTGFFVLAMMLSSISILGQNGFYKTDTMGFYGVKVFDGGDKLNARFCRVLKKGKIVQYSPFEVIEYGTNEELVYVSKEIQTKGTKQQVFLMRLVEGEASLFFFKDDGYSTYFLEKDNSLFIELPKEKTDQGGKDFQNLLAEYVSRNEQMAQTTQMVKYRKRSMAKYVERFNYNETKPFPVFKYGVNVGFGLAKLNPSPGLSNPYLQEMDYEYDGGFTIGLFADCPILVSDFSLHVDLYYSQNSYSLYNQLEYEGFEKDIDFVVNMSSLSMPILIRYAIPTNKIRPFINAGGIMAYNPKHESTLYESTIEGYTVEQRMSSTSLISSFQMGYSLGAGLEFALSTKLALMIDIRYNHLFPISEPENYRSSNYLITAGISF